MLFFSWNLSFKNDILNNATHRLVREKMLCRDFVEVTVFYCFFYALIASKLKSVELLCTTTDVACNLRVVKNSHSLII